MELSTSPHPDAVSLLSDIAVAISESDDVDSLAQRCIANVASLFRAKSAALWLVDAAGTTLTLRAQQGPEVPTALRRIPINRSLIGEIASSRKPRMAEPTSAEFGLPIDDWAKGAELTAFAGSPMMLRGKLIGVVSIFASHRLNQRTPALLRSLCQAIAAGIERKQSEEDNARLYEELQRTTEALQRANAVKSEFLGLISHELRSPISTVVGNSLLLLNRGHLIDEADRRQALLDIVAEADRLHRVIENLLLLVRVEAGQKLEVEPVNLSRILREAIEGFYRRHSGRQVHIEDRGDAPIALGEPTLVTLIIDNLISNANKYSPEGAPIEVHLGANEEGLPEIRVRDYGIGLDEVDIETLFVPFYRSNRAKTQAKGVGLGLAVCKRVVEAQDGRIWAEARSGGGSDFVFTLKPAPAGP